MPLSDDPWIAENSIIDPERLHALGVITLFWNHCERMLFLIFCVVFQFTPRFGWIIAHDMGDISLSDRIREILKVRPTLLPDEKELILNALDVYDVCRQNRNTLTHFTVNISSREDAEIDFKFVRTKGPDPTAKEFPCTLKDVRSVAFNTKVLSVYLHKIYQAIIDRQAGKDVPLPPIVGAPGLLSTPHPQADKAPQPQRLPSVLKLTEEEWIAKYRKEGRPLPE
jgi:hypothetical protein